MYYLDQMMLKEDNFRWNISKINYIEFLNWLFFHQILIQHQSLIWKISRLVKMSLEQSSDKTKSRWINEKLIRYTNLSERTKWKEPIFRKNKTKKKIDYRLKHR